MVEGCRVVGSNQVGCMVVECREDGCMVVCFKIWGCGGRVSGGGCGTVRAGVAITAPGVPHPGQGGSPPASLAYSTVRGLSQWRAIVSHPASYTLL